ncbi:MAG: hypothetical protein KC713_06610, partial [Candidatus Omnitrophica bacterium]|nr:hypothetical protein [Candidatus Omnitrophota bacterium]
MSLRKKIFRAGSFLLLFFGIGLLSVINPSAQTPNVVHIIQLNDDTINPATAEYITSSIKEAEEADANCLVMKLDTPGGLLNSTRLIVKEMLQSSVPIVVYIAPNGSRAGSAGVFLTYASHIAAMAPSTNIGAAHPVQYGGGQRPVKEKSGDWEDLQKMIQEIKDLKGIAQDESEEPQQDPDKKPADGTEQTKEKLPGSSDPQTDPMESKILNDTVAFIQSIAKLRNRNAEWAKVSVTESQSITADEALEKGVVEIIAASDQELLEKIHGRVVQIDHEEIRLQTKDARIVYKRMPFRLSFFNILANP